MHNPVILSGVKDLLPASAITSPGRSLYHRPAPPRTGHWPLTTGH
jgi:hypothetical protein